MSFRKFVFPLIAILLICGSVCWSQITTGSMHGTVNDPDGKPVPGATVTISSPALIGGSRTAYTNELGVFRFPSLPVGTYTVSATLSGFRTVENRDVTLEVGQKRTMDFTREVSAISTEVTVALVRPPELPGMKLRGLPIVKYGRTPLNSS